MRQRKTSLGSLAMRAIFEESVRFYTLKVLEEVFGKISIPDNKPAEFEKKKYNQSLKGKISPIKALMEKEGISYSTAWSRLHNKKKQPEYIPDGEIPRKKGEKPWKEIKRSDD